MTLTKSQQKQKEKQEQYWKEREAEQLKHYITQEAEYQKHIELIYDYMMDQIQKEINGFYTKYASKEGITMAEAKRRVSKLDMEEYERRAAKYVAEKNFSDQANEEMRLYNATMKINRLEMLKANIGLELVSGFDELQKYFDTILTDRTLEEFERQAGILGATIQNNEKAAHAIVNASFHNADFKDRAWMYQDMLKSELSKLLQTGLIQGRNPKVLATHLSKLFGVEKYKAERLMRTELARVRIEAQKQSYERNGYEEYQFHALGTACGICKDLDGKHFPIKDMRIAENAPPCHPNCRCSTSAWMDREEFDKWLSEQGKGQSQADMLDKMRLSDDADYEKLPGMTQELREEIDAAIQKIQEEYEVKLSAITSGKMGRGDIFGSGPYLDENGQLKFALAFNSNADYNKIKQRIDHRYSKGIFAGKSIEDYVAHEMAHIMIYQDCESMNAYNTKKTIIEKLFVEGISGYADKTKSGDESLAEAFVKYRNKEKIPLQAEILVRTYIERWKK